MQPSPTIRRLIGESRYPTLSDALDAVRSEHGIGTPGTRGYQLEVEEGWEDVFAMGGVRYGETKKTDVEILSLNGKPTRKWLHVTIYRDERGMYEQVAYVL